MEYLLCFSIRLKISTTLWNSPVIGCTHHHDYNLAFFSKCLLAFIYTKTLLFVNPYEKKNWITLFTWTWTIKRTTLIFYDWHPHWHLKQSCLLAIVAILAWEAMITHYMYMYVPCVHIKQVQVHVYFYQSARRISRNRTKCWPPLKNWHL